MGFPGGSDGKESASNAEDPGSMLGLGRSFGEGVQPTPVLLPGESHGRRSRAGYCPQGRKELDTTEQLMLPCGSADQESTCNAGDLASIPELEDLLEKEGKGNPYSSILAWRISWTVQSMGLQRAGHD